MDKLNENQLNLLLSFGLITEQEKSLLIKRYKETNSILDLKKSYISVLENSIKEVDTEIIATEKSLEELKKNNNYFKRKAFKEIENGAKEISDAFQKEIEDYNKISSKALKEYELEIASLDRKMEEKLHHDLKRIEEKVLAKIRAQIS